MELVVEPDFYAPSINDHGDYIDKIPSFHIIKKGLRCPCGCRKDKLYDSYAVFAAHMKTKAHQSWLGSLNQNKTNYYVENERAKSTIHNQQLIIAKFERELHAKNITIDYLSLQLVNASKTSAIECNLLEFD